MSTTRSRLLSLAWPLLMALVIAIAVGMVVAAVWMIVELVRAANRGDIAHTLMWGFLLLALTTTGSMSARGDRS